MNTEKIKERLNLHVKRRIQSELSLNDNNKTTTQPVANLKTQIETFRPPSTGNSSEPDKSTSSTKGLNLIKRNSDTENGINSSALLRRTTSKTNSPKNINTQNSAATSNDSHSMSSTNTEKLHIRKIIMSPSPRYPKNGGHCYKEESSKLKMILDKKKLLLMKDPSVLELLTNIKQVCFYHSSFIY